MGPEWLWRRSGQVAVSGMWNQNILFPGTLTSNFLASVAHFFWPSSSHDEYGNLVTGVASGAGRLYSRNARMVYRRARSLGLSVCYGKDYLRWPHQDHIPGRQWSLKGTVHYTLIEEESHNWKTDSPARWRTDLLGKELPTVFWQVPERNVTGRHIRNTSGRMPNHTLQPYYFQWYRHC